MKPSIGRIVVYTPSELDKDLMVAAQKLKGGCNVMFKLPAIITAVWSDEVVNLKVICDGNIDLWKTSVLKGDDPVNWNWPVIEK